MRRGWLQIHRSREEQINVSTAWELNAEDELVGGMNACQSGRQSVVDDCIDRPQTLDVHTHGRCVEFTSGTDHRPTHRRPACSMPIHRK